MRDLPFFISPGDVMMVTATYLGNNIDQLMWNVWAPKNWCLQTVVLEKTPESPLDSREIKPVNPKGMQRADLLEKTLMLGKIEGRRRKGQQRMRWLDGITDLMDMSLSKLQEMVKDRGAWGASVHRVTKIWTWLCDWTTTKNKEYSLWQHIFLLAALYVYTGAILT